MGWLVHGAAETSWGTARLFWTAIGIVLSLWATRTIWPSKSIPNLHQALATMVNSLSEEFSLEADRLAQDASTVVDVPPTPTSSSIAEAAQRHSRPAESAS